MRPTFDITGLRSGRLVAIRRVPTPLGKKAAVWLAKCDCGKEAEVSCSKLRTGHTKSCGCLKSETTSARVRKHGESKTSRLYGIWAKMRGRCNNPNQPMFYRYGERGIKVCAEWDDYLHFKTWALLNGYAENLSIERNDNSKGYNPENCRWIPLSEQAANRDMNIMVEFNGKTQCVAHHANDVGLKQRTVHARIRSGWDPVEALTRPLDERQSANAKRRFI